MDNQCIYACSEHVDEGIDEYVNEKETFPILSECTSGRCFSCDNNSNYKIG
ncbi:CxxH/CxxC protein [Clostridium paraputrificum]|uniref:CxxH/CxxC protein n=1 Tax=Clostridium TaxID=1485 RepID=UPI003D34F607